MSKLISYAPGLTILLHNFLVIHSVYCFLGQSDIWLRVSQCFQPQTKSFIYHYFVVSCGVSWSIRHFWTSFTHAIYHYGAGIAFYDLSVHL